MESERILQNGILPQRDDNQPPICAIAIMSSLGCNLKCEYCVINASRQFDTKRANDLQKKTIQALKDGSFKENAVKSVKAFGGSPNDIRRIELWGQEQILTLDYFIDGLGGWLEAFPNWHELSFSTNGQAGADKIVRLIKTLDELSDRPFHFGLQWSYDGSYSGSELRHDSDNKVIKNLKKVIEDLNQVPLKNVEVEFYLHGVISFELIKHLNGDLEKIKSYWDECRKTAEELPALGWNRNVKVFGTFSVAEEVPYHCSTAEGLDYFDFLIKSYACDGCLSGLEFLCGQWSRIIDFAFPEKKNYTLDEIVTWLNNVRKDSFSDSMNFVTRELTNGFYCGTGVSELKLMYDGTLVNCQNSIFETTEDNIDPEVTLQNEVKRSWVKKNWFINPQTASEEDLARYKYMFMTGRRSTFWHSWNTTIAKMHYMALNGQISHLYRDDLKLLINHAYIITYINQCMYNNAIYTGSMWTKDTGIIRRYANGFAEFSERKENNIRLNARSAEREGDNFGNKE